MEKATIKQIKDAAAATSSEEVKVAMHLYAEMRSLEDRITALNGDMDGTIKGLTDTGFSEMSKIFRSLGGQDWYRFKDIMSYWREEE